MRGNLWLALMAGNTSQRTERLGRRGEDILGGSKMVSVNKGKEKQDKVCSADQDKGKSLTRPKCKEGNRGRRSGQSGLGPEGKYHP